MRNSGRTEFSLAANHQGDRKIVSGYSVTSLHFTGTANRNMMRFGEVTECLSNWHSM